MLMARGGRYLWQALQSSDSSGRAVSLAVVLCLCGGLAKGRFVLAKAALRNRRRIAALSKPKPWQIFSPRFYPLIMVMMGMSIGLRKLFNTGFAGGMVTYGGIAAKRLWAGLLRSVLRSASKQLHLDRGTVLFLQGDLNSRTFLEGRGKDLLLEVLKDLPLQRAIQRGMDLPNGRWYEVACPDTAKGALQLPVTYKFIPTSEASAIRIGDVLEEAGKARLFPNAVSSGHSPKKYRETMVDAEDACSRWGLAFQKKKNFRPFRFPACPDRMIYWAPDVLAPRLFWEPYQGYRVNHEQRGSDHKPVWLDLLLRVAPAGSSQCEEAIDEDVADLEELGLPHEATGSRSWWPRRQECGWNWTPDNDAADCEICDVPFSFLRRRHHCRHCGRCICDTCSPVECWRIVPEIEATRPSRFCIECSRPPSEAADD
ncbi:unnamed protein product [Durusdinium trenchii]|uniref:FYVE-type domain-containing protein n=1 Tax=Durusdinium trenchii TaxID=1381693 RepID=A0ABP0NFK7_9DINO